MTLRTVLLLPLLGVLLGADRALAQQTIPPSSTSVASPQGELIPRDNADGQPLGFFQRTGIGWLGGMGGGLVGAGIGALTGQLLAVQTSSKGCGTGASETCFGARLSGALIGAALAGPAGTALARSVSGGQGTYVSAMVGSLLGAIPASIGAAIFLQTSSGDVEPWEMVATAGVLTLPALGSALLYERTHDQALQPSSRSVPAVSPAIARVLLEMLYGGLGGIVMGVVGFGAGFAAGGCSYPDGCYTTGDEIVSTSVLATVYTLGVTFGVYAGGSQAGGRGGYVPVLVGGALGAALGSGAVVLDKDAAVPGVLLGSFVGAIVGYEVGHALAEPAPQSARARSSTTGLHAVPVIAPLSSGGVIGGLAGHF